MRKYTIALFVISIIFGIYSCEDDWFIEPIENNLSFKQRLSGYNIYRLPLPDLVPDTNAFVYELNTALFTDYAAKQRVIKLPKGQPLSIRSHSSIDFPEGTIIAKTFFYSKDQLVANEGPKRILETRLLILNKGQWNVGVYKWNNSQTEAYLIKEGASESLEQVLPSGQIKRFTYEIPSISECTTCHNSNNTVRPIGPKVANLNIPQWGGPNISQLESWVNKGYLSATSVNNLPELPQWDKSNHSLSQRARAYLDVNCAHCHNPSGVASDWSLDLRYTTPYSQTGIDPLRCHFPERMESDWADEVMPKIGTTLKHKEGIALIKNYVNQL